MYGGAVPRRDVRRALAIMPNDPAQEALPPDVEKTRVEAVPGDAAGMNAAGQGTTRSPAEPAASTADTFILPDSHPETAEVIFYPCLSRGEQGLCFRWVC